MMETSNIFTTLKDHYVFQDFSSAWEKVTDIYSQSIHEIKNLFREFESVAEKEIKKSRKAEINDFQIESIVNQLNNSNLTNRVAECTYPLIGIVPKKDLFGTSHDWKNKILKKDNEYWITVTRPENKLIKKYFAEEFNELCQDYKEYNNDVGFDIYVCKSNLQIPLTFAFDIDGQETEILNDSIIRRIIPKFFSLPDLSLISDAIMDKNIKKFRNSYDVILRKTFGDSLIKEKNLCNDSWWVDNVSSLHPLTYFDALRTDISFTRLKHYTHTDLDNFQPFILFTNYDNYVKEFIHHYYSEFVSKGEGKLSLPIPNILANGKTEKDYILDKKLHESEMSEYFNVIEDKKGNAKFILKEEWIDRTAQMPAFHYQPNEESETGITLINIGVGPSNAKNITDHLAVLRPYCWLMLGHCGGLRYRQQLGQFILAQSYIRDDQVLDDVLPKWVPLPVVLEIQEAFEKATKEILRANLEKQNRDIVDFSSYYRSKMRVGVVYTTADRNWEFQPHENLRENLELSRAIAIEMESATIAGNGFRYRIPYGTFLCVSDRPLHGEIKMRNMADKFYRESTENHLKIAIRAINILKDKRTIHKGETSQFEKLKFTRKLRGADDPIFR